MRKQNSILYLKNYCKDVATTVLDISYRAKTGHIGSALSICDIVSVLYAERLHVAKDDFVSSEKRNPQRDRFILSKGHAAATLYSVLYKKNILHKSELESFGADSGGLCEHPIIFDRGVEMTAGSLGHGIAFGAGIAWGVKMRLHAEVAKKNLDASSVSLVKTRKNVKSRHSLSQSEAALNFFDSPHALPHIFVLISDGECGEGSVWEAAMFASRMKLDNLTVILDNNGWQCFGKTKNITQLQPLAAKWKSFGFSVRVIDGHNLQQIRDSYNNVPFKASKPSIIIANTISGHGIPFIENQLVGHYKIFSDSEYQESKSLLQKLYK